MKNKPGRKPSLMIARAYVSNKTKKEFLAYLELIKEIHFPFFTRMLKVRYNIKRPNTFSDR